MPFTVTGALPSRPTPAGIRLFLAILAGGILVLERKMETTDFRH